MTPARGRRGPGEGVPPGAIAASMLLHAGIVAAFVALGPARARPPLVWIDAARLAELVDEPAKVNEPPPDPPKIDPPAPVAPAKIAPPAHPIPPPQRPPDEAPRAPDPAPSPPPGPAPGPGPAGPGELAGAGANGSGMTAGGTPGGGLPPQPPSAPAPTAAPAPEVKRPPACPRPAVTYPAEARRRGLEGEVTAQLLVREDGSIADARIVRSAGPTLDDAVLALVRAMRCAPARAGDRPIAAPLPYTVRFVLEDP